MSKITSYFSPATPEQAAEQASCGFEIIRQETRTRKAQKVLEDAKKAYKRTKDATQRQRRWRQQIKENESKLGLRDPGTLRKVKVMQLRLESPEPDDTEPTPSKPRAKRSNPYEPTRWAIID